MSTTEQEAGMTSPFGGSVASDEQELAIDEIVPESNAVPILQFVPDLDVVVRGRGVREESIGGSRNK